MDMIRIFLKPRKKEDARNLMGQAAREVKTDARHKVQSLAVAVRDRGQSAIDASRNGVRRWPLAAVGGAVVAGMMLDRWVLHR